MPIYKNPFEKGNLYIKFDVIFPEKNSLSLDTIKVTKIKNFLN
jgi:DnaJ homolog subfamily A member 2